MNKDVLLAKQEAVQEIVSKADLFEAYNGYKAFLGAK